MASGETTKKNRRKYGGKNW